MAKEQTKPAERPDITAARETLAAAQQTYDDLVKQSRQPHRDADDAKKLTAALTAALAAKRVAAAELEAVLAGRRAPKQMVEAPAVPPQKAEA